MLTKFNSCHQNEITRFEKTNKRFRRTVFNEEEIDNFDFESGLISKNIKEYKFTNYAQSMNDDVYNYVLDYYISYLNDDFSFISRDFNMDEEELKPNYKILRLLNILKAVQGRKYNETDCPYILKLNSLKNAQLHFYLWKSRRNLKLILIDLYHLGIYGRRYINGKENFINIERLYRHHRKNNCDLAEIKEINEMFVKQ